MNQQSLSQLFSEEVFRDIMENNNFSSGYTNLYERDGIFSSEDNSTTFEIEKIKLQLQDGSYVPIPISATNDLCADQVYANTAPSIPSNTDYGGDYNFCIGFDNVTTSGSSKGQVAIYSEAAKKLYVQPFKACPIRFCCNPPPPSECYIRAMPIFMQPEYVRDVVKRCPNHTKDPKYNDHPAPEHLIRCQNNDAKYVIDPVTGRQTVIVPYEFPQAGTQFVTYLYQFMCFTSCVGGLNRRPIQVIFTLEDSRHIVIGRRVIEVRMCACPSRDRQIDEKNKYPKQSPKRASNVGHLTEILTVGPLKRLRPDDEIFTIAVKGRENYEMLLRLKTKLEVADTVSQDREAHPSSSFTHVSSFSNGVGVVNNSQPFQPYFAPSPLQEPTSSQENIETAPIKCESSFNGPSTSNYQDFSVSSWLQSIEMGAYTDRFSEKHLYTRNQLQDLTYESLTAMKIGIAHRNKIWQALQELKNVDNVAVQSSPPLPSSLPNSGSSTFSAWSQGSKPEGIEITRLTFKHCITVKDNNT